MDADRSRPQGPSFRLDGAPLGEVSLRRRSFPYLRSSGSIDALRITLGSDGRGVGVGVGDAEGDFRGAQEVGSSSFSRRGIRSR